MDKLSSMNRSDLMKLFSEYTIRYARMQRQHFVSEAEFDKCRETMKSIMDEINKRNTTDRFKNNPPSDSNNR